MIIECLKKQYSFVFFESSINLPKSSPFLDICKGDFSKAVIKYQELALMGKEPEENLRKAAEIMLELGCFQELSIFITWAFTNFSQEVIFEMLQIASIS